MLAPLLGAGSFVLIFSLLLVEPQLARAADIPAPWDQMTSLTATQRDQIAAVNAKANADLASDRVKIRSAVAARHEHDGLQSLIPIDTASGLRMAEFTTRLMENGAIRSLLQPNQFKEANSVWSKFEQVIDIADFQNFSAKQQNDLYCWAAAIQIMLNYSGVAIDQQEVADQIVGNADPATVKPQDLAAGVTGWRMNHKDPKKTWVAECDYNFIANPPPEPVIIRLMNVGRQIQLSMGGQHVVVIHRVKYTGWWDKPKVEEVTVFDPLTGHDDTLAWPELKTSLAGWWYCFASVSGSRWF